jgi:hypothetical protein
VSVSGSDALSSPGSNRRATVICSASTTTRGGCRAYPSPSFLTRLTDVQPGSEESQGLRYVGCSPKWMEPALDVSGYSSIMLPCLFGKHRGWPAQTDFHKEPRASPQTCGDREMRPSSFIVKMLSTVAPAGFPTGRRDTRRTNVQCRCASMASFSW